MSHGDSPDKRLLDQETKEYIAKHKEDVKEAEVRFLHTMQCTCIKYCVEMSLYMNYILPFHDASFF